MSVRTAMVAGLCLAPLAAFGSGSADEFRSAYAAYRAAVHGGNRRDAVVHAQRSLDLGRELYGEANPRTAALALNLGNALLADARIGEAWEILRATLRAYERLYPQDARELIDPLIARGDADNERFKSPHLSRAHFGDPSEELVALNTHIGARLLEARHLRAGVYLLSAVKGVDGLYGRDDPRAYGPLFQLARYYEARGKYGQAERLLEGIIEVLAARPETHGSIAELSARALLVDVLQRQDRAAEATRHCVAIGAAIPWSGGHDPKPIYAVRPDYPIPAWHGRKEGYVLLEFRIDPDGFVRAPKVIERQGPRSFARKGIEAIEQWRYAPKVVNGEPVLSEPVHARITFEVRRDGLSRATLNRFD